MSDTQNNDANLPKESHLDSSDLITITETFNSCMDASVSTLSSITSESNVSYSKADINVVKASEIDGFMSDTLVRLNIKTGIPGYCFAGVPQNTSQFVANSMMGCDESNELELEVYQSAISEATNQMLGSMCVLLARSVNDSIDIGIPETVNTSNLTSANLFNGTFRDDSLVCKVEYSININSFELKLIFVFALNTIKSTAFKIKTTESKNLLRLNPDLSKTIAEYFTLLGVKYKTIYSMVGVIDNVSVLELNSIHSLQCLDADVINNYNIVNKNKQKDLFNIFIFEKNFVSDMKKTSGLTDDEESTWDILKELNNQFTYIFLEYCSDNSLAFDNIECSNFLELPDNQYLLISFSVGDYKFYQLLSFGLLDKIQMKLTKDDKERIKDKSIANISKVGYNSENNEVAIIDDIDVDSLLPLIYKQIPFEISAILGEKTFTIKDLLHFNTGFIIHLDRKVTDDIDICINGVKKAEGEVGELTFNKSNNYAVKIKKLQKE